MGKNNNKQRGGDISVKPNIKIVNQQGIPQGIVQERVDDIQGKKIDTPEKINAIPKQLP